MPDSATISNTVPPNSSPNNTAQLPQMTMYSLFTQQLDIVHTVIKAIVFFYIIVCIPLLLTYSLIFPVCSVLLLINPYLMHYAIDQIAAIWFITPITWLMINGTKFSIYCDNNTYNIIQSQSIRTASNIMISNHRTTADWVYLWYLQDHCMSLNQLKIVMKDALRKLAPLGWPLQFAIHFFLKRSWEADKQHITHLIEYYAQGKHMYKVQLLLFPEGTDLHDKAIKRSNDYAEKNHLPLYKHVLHPRTTGYTYILQLLRQYNSIEYIYDITIAYPYQIDKYTHKPTKNPQKLEQLVSGKFPTDVMFYVNLYKNTELPKNDTELNQWCTNIWAEKEKRLTTVYKQPNGRFVESDGTPSKQIVVPSSVYVKYIVQSTVLTLFTFYVAYSIYQSYYLKIYVLVVSVIMTLFTYANGLDVLIVHRELYKRRKLAYEQTQRSKKK